MTIRTVTIDVGPDALHLLETPITAELGTICHRHSDSRSCGASTVVSGQNFVKVNGQLWAVAGDGDSHGGGALIATQSYIKIAGKLVILQGDPASADSLCIPVGGNHCSPTAVSGDSLVTVGL